MLTSKTDVSNDGMVSITIGSARLGASKNAAIASALAGSVIKATLVPIFIPASYRVKVSTTRASNARLVLSETLIDKGVTREPPGITEVRTSNVDFFSRFKIVIVVDTIAPPLRDSSIV